jgi:superfamily II DNA or RNA helicase
MSADYGNDDGSEHDLVLGTQQTLISRTLKAPDLIVFDECHLLAPNSASWKWVEQFPDAKVIGLTATPYRGKEHISSFGWNTIYAISIPELVRLGYLVPPRSMATGTLAASFETNNLVKTDMLLPPLLLKVKAESKRRTIVFCQDIPHAQHVAKQLKRLGETSVFLVHSRMSDTAIDAQYAAFEHATERSWLINVTLVSIGVDIPCIDCVVILRDVSSYSLFVQMVGRGLRVCDPKKECLVFDFGRATNRFGFIDQPDFKDSTSNTEGGNGMTKFKTCFKCGTQVALNAKTCPHCRNDFDFESKLREMSSDAPLLSAAISIETVHDVSVAKTSEFAWEMTCWFRGGEVSTKDYFRQAPRVPAVGSQFLIEMLETNSAVIRSPLQ